MTIHLMKFVIGLSPWAKYRWIPSPNKRPCNGIKKKESRRKKCNEMNYSFWYNEGIFKITISR